MSNRKRHPLERIALDIRVIGQHQSVAAHLIENAGRVLLAMPTVDAWLTKVT